MLGAYGYMMANSILRSQQWWTTEAFRAVDEHMKTLDGIEAGDVG